jgi:hypothetical protein
MNLLRQGAELLEQVRDSFSTETVTYQRGALTESVQATPGKTEFEYDDGNGVNVAAQVIDFLITKTYLVDKFTKPQAGDRIVFGTKTYEVVPVAGEYFRDSDSYDLTWRIHTKEI